MARTASLHHGPPIPHGWFDHLIGMVGLWHHRSQSRAKLENLDDHLLADIGLNRFDAANERNKPFWQA